MIKNGEYFVGVATGTERDEIIIIQCNKRVAAGSVDGQRGARPKGHDTEPAARSADWWRGTREVPTESEQSAEALATVGSRHSGPPVLHSADCQSVLKYIT